METLFPSFVDEAGLILGRLKRSLQNLVQEFTQEEVDSVFRDIHTLKSSMRAVGIHNRNI